MGSKAIPYEKGTIDITGMINDKILHETHTSKPMIDHMRISNDIYVNEAAVQNNNKGCEHNAQCYQNDMSVNRFDNSQDQVSFDPDHKTLVAVEESCNSGGYAGSCTSCRDDNITSNQLQTGSSKQRRNSNDSHYLTAMCNGQKVHDSEIDNKNKLQIQKISLEQLQSDQLDSTMRDEELQIEDHQNDDNSDIHSILLTQYLDNNRGNDVHNNNKKTIIVTFAAH